MTTEDLKTTISECEIQMAQYQKHIEAIQANWLEKKRERARLMKVLEAMEVVDDFNSLF